MTGTQSPDHELCPQVLVDIFARQDITVVAVTSLPTAVRDKISQFVCPHGVAFYAKCTVCPNCGAAVDDDASCASTGCSVTSQRQDGRRPGRSRRPRDRRR